LGRVNVDGVQFHTVKYDVRLFDELASAGVRPPSLLRYIDEYEPAAAPERLACDLWHMDQIYFRHESVPTRRTSLLRKLLVARPEWLDYQAFLLSNQQRLDAQWVPANSLRFEHRDEQAELSGDAFQNNPTAREGVGQRALAGTRGRFMNTFQDENGSQATGTYTSSPFRIEGELITLQIGGGHFPDGEYVELLVGGERQFHATGCNSGITGQRLWVTRGLRGQVAQLRIVDRLRRELGHIVVDELVQWKRQTQAEVAPPLGQPLEAGHSVHD
jgi:hypothetical protein